MFCARPFICASWSPAGKGLTSWLSFVVSSVSLSLSHWYPGSGVVLDCIDSWSLQPYLLWNWPKIKSFSKLEVVKKRKKKTLWYNSWHELHKRWLCLTAYRRLSSIRRCLFCATNINASHNILLMDSLHIFYPPPFKLFPHFKYRRFIVKICKYLFMLQIRPTGNSNFQFQKRWRTDNHELL